MALKIVQKLITASKYPLKATYSMKPEFVVVHNTANDAPATNEVSYMSTNKNATSFHYAVDNLQAVQGIPENRNSWNAGDGANGKGNRKGIAIEICYSKSGGTRFIAAEKNAVLLIVDILKRYKWGIDKVKKHQDFNKKYCPHRTLDMGWNRFLDMVKTELNTKPQPTPVNDNLYKVIKSGKQIGAFKNKDNAFDLWYSDRTQRVTLNGKDLTSDFNDMANKLQGEIDGLKIQLENQKNAWKTKEIELNKQHSDAIFSIEQEHKTEVEQLKDQITGKETQRAKFQRLYQELKDFDKLPLMSKIKSIFMDAREIAREKKTE